MKGEVLNPVEFEIRPLPRHKRDIAPPVRLTRDALKSEIKRVRKEYLRLIHRVNKTAKHKKGSYQWQNEFDRWQDVDKLKPLIGAFLKDQLERLVSYEAGDGINRIRACGYRGIGRTAWMADLKFYNFRYLGDGTPTLNKDTRIWESHQQKVERPTYISHLRIRKRK